MTRAFTEASGSDSNFLGTLRAAEQSQTFLMGGDVMGRDW
jgi:hypothetical protein